MILLDIVLDGLPVSKNKRTVLDKRTNHLYTGGEARAYMEAVTLQTRLKRERAWRHGEEMYLTVRVLCKEGLHKFDLDGCLPIIVDAVLNGMLSADMAGANPPDQWITSIEATKELGTRDRTHIVIGTEDGGG